MRRPFLFAAVAFLVLSISFSCKKPTSSDNNPIPVDTTDDTTAALLSHPDSAWADSISLTSFRASWNKADGIDSYMVVVCIGSDSAIDTIATTDTTCKITDLIVNNTYRTSVYGCSSNVWSEEHSRSAFTPVYTFRAPRNVRLDSTWATGAQITFDACEDNFPGMQSYRLYVRDQDGNLLDSTDVDTSDRSAAVSDLQTGKVYKLSLVTVGDLGAGANDSNCYYDTSASNYNTLRLPYVYASTYTTPVALTDSLAPVKGGIFLMGYIWDHNADVRIKEYGPRHEVIVSSFHMSKFEVTASQYSAFLNSRQNDLTITDGKIILGSDTLADTIHSTWPLSYNGSEFSVKSGKGNYPMLGLFWHGAAAFCNYYSKLQNQDTCYNSEWVCNFSKNGYRLPTEAEFEYAASAGFNGEKRRFTWGFEYDSTMGAVRGTGPVPVGSYAALNGIYDLTGNAMEYVNDWSDVSSETVVVSDYYTQCLQQGVVTDPRGPAAQVENYKHLMRGGSYELDATGTVTTYRYANPCNTTSDYGFRMVRNAP